MTTRAGLRIFLFLLASAFALFAQQEDTNTRSVRGAVTNPAGQPVQGAVVQLKDTKTLQIRSFFTQGDGSYHFAGLSPNVNYDLHAEYNGSHSPTKTLSVFDTKKDTTINLKLK